ncbi:MAG TPA: hypothetical protein VEA99_15800 [Gemmatimonadaceae bacterium]|nr:hypothetical protein [Gemmatimonadaceae bacterium]
MTRRVLSLLPALCLALACGDRPRDEPRFVTVRDGHVLGHQPADTALAGVAVDLAALDAGLARVVDSLGHAVRATGPADREPAVEEAPPNPNLVGRGEGRPERGMVIPAGSNLMLRSLERACTHTHAPGDSVTLSVEGAALPADARVILRVVDAQASTGRASAYLELAAEVLRVDGRRFPLAASIEAADLELDAGPGAGGAARRLLAAVTRGVVAAGRWDACLPRGGALRLGLEEPLTVVLR